MLYDKKWGKQVEVELEQWRRTLLNAADYIEEHGWAQGQFEMKGSVCPLRALTIVHQDNVDMTTAWVRLLKYIKEDSIIGWNDKINRTKEEVIAAMRAAALS